MATDRKRKNIIKRIFRRKRKTIVLGVHGLGNKPARSLLQLWWKKSLLEGLAKIEGAPNRFRFKMIYWADIMYPKPLDPTVKDPDHELHIEEPYLPEPIPSPRIRYTPWHYSKLFWDKMKERVFLSRRGLANYRILFDLVVKSSFKDLAAYYEEVDRDEDRVQIHAVKKKIRQRLKARLRKHRNDRVLVVAHSMGSLIAYDVLSDLPSHYQVEVFISMGSPLGLPVLREKIARDHGLPYSENTILPTPESVERWYNYSDENDNISVFHDLASFYGKNSHGVCPEDVLVINDYKDWVTNNAHKSFGYLRTPQLARVVAEFLGIRKKNIWQRSKKYIERQIKRGGRSGRSS